VEKTNSMRESQEKDVSEEETGAFLVLMMILMASDNCSDSMSIHKLSMIARATTSVKSPRIKDLRQELNSSNPNTDILWSFLIHLGEATKSPNRDEKSSLWKNDSKGDRVLSLCRTISYTGNGCFQSCSMDQCNGAAIVVQKMTYVGRIICLALQRIQNQTKFKDEAWLCLLSSWIHFAPKNVELDTTTIVAVIVSTLVEHCSSWSFRRKWLVELNQLCTKTRHSHEDNVQNSACTASMGCLRVVNAFLENSDSSTDESVVDGYDDELGKIMKLPLSPKLHQRFVLAVLPRAKFRQTIFHHAQHSWLHGRNPHQTQSPFSIWATDTLIASETNSKGQVHDITRLALWTFLQLTKHTGWMTANGNIVWGPLCQFIIEGSPCTPISVRSWFINAISEVVLSDKITTQVPRAIQDRDTLTKIVRSFLIRFFQLTEHVQLKSADGERAWYCCVSLPRLFVRVGDSFEPTENISALFLQLIRLRREIDSIDNQRSGKYGAFLANLISELSTLLCIGDFLNSRQTRDVKRAENESFIDKEETNTPQDEAMDLCTEILINFVAKGGGVQQTCSFTKLRIALCGHDSDLSQSNSAAQKRLTSGTIPNELADTISGQVRCEIVNALIELLLSEETLGFVLNYAAPVVHQHQILGVVCSLSSLKEEYDSSSRLDHFRYLSETFPRFVSVARPALVCIISENLCTKSDQRMNSQSSTRPVDGRLNEASMVVSALLVFCADLKTAVEAGNLELNDKLIPLCESLVTLYDVFCPKAALDSFAVFLERRCVENSRGNSLSPTSVFRSLETAVDIDRVTRDIRKRVLVTIKSCLNALRQPAEALHHDSQIWSDGHSHSNILCFATRILAQCGQDLREGLDGASGGLSTEEYQVYMECIEAACQCISMVSPQHPTLADTELILTTCSSVATLAEDIVCSIAIRNCSLFRRTLHLFLRTLPAVVDGAVHLSLITGVHGKVPPVSTQLQRVFDQCFRILTTWSQSCRVGTPWNAVVDPGHLRAGQLGDMDDIDHSDVDETPSTENCRTITFVDNKDESQLKSSIPLIQLESQRHWTWSCSTLFESYRASVEDSYLGPMKCKKIFPSDKTMTTYFLRRTDFFAEVFKNSTALFSESDRALQGDPIALAMPQSTKSAFRALLEMLLKTIGFSLDIICEEIGNSCERKYYMVEALACAFAWVNSAPVGVDICHGVCLWSYFEGRAADRLKRGNTMHVVDKIPMPKKLEKPVFCAKDVEASLEQLHLKVQDDPQMFDGWLECFNTQQQIGSCVEAVARKSKRLHEQRALHGDKLNVPNTSLTKGKAQKKRRSTSTAQPAVRRSRKERIPQSRNNLVRNWLQKDREIGKEEKFQEEAYADLEDFLVDG